MRTVDPNKDPDKVREFLKDASLHDISGWIEKYPTMLPKFEVIVSDRIRSMRMRISPRDKDECYESDVEEFFCVLIRLPQFNMSVYNLLNLMVNHTICPRYGEVNTIDSSDISIWTRIEVIALLDDDKVMNDCYQIFNNLPNNKVMYLFMLRLIDVYIPTHNPHALAKAMVTYTSLDRILKEAKYTERIVERFKPCHVEGVTMKQIILLHKIISDIYTNKESSYEFFEKYHKLLNTSFFIRHEIARIEKKYMKYIGPDNTSDMFYHSLFFLMGHGFTTNASCGYDLKENVDAFLREFSYTYKENLSTPVLKVILLDIANVVRSHDIYQFKEDTIQYVMKEILERWESNEYRKVPFDLSNECTLLPTDTPISTLDKINELVDLEVATEAKETSAKMNNAERKIYKAYRTYKENEEKVDSQITKACKGIKNVLTGNVREEIIEGKKFSAIGLLKKLLGGVALFSFSKIIGVITVVTHFALKKSTTESERSKILMEIDTEIEMLNEKINDARGDNNREAKYAMMRTKKELENAKARIEYGMSADKGSLQKTRKTLDQSRQERGVV